MTASAEVAPGRPARYRQEVLAAAFDRVRHPRDWRGPVRGVIPCADRELTHEAVVWFTGIPPVFTPLAGEPDRLVVTAESEGLGRVEPQGSGHDHR